MKFLLSNVRDMIFSIAQRLFDVLRRWRGNKHPELERRILRRRDETMIADIIKQHLGVNTIKSLKLITHGNDCLVAEVDNTWIFKFPNDADTAIDLMKEARVLKFLHGRLSLQIPNLDISQTGHLFSCHRKIPGTRFFYEDYRQLDNITKDAFAEDLARFFAELHQIKPGDVADLNVGKIPAWMSDEQFAQIQCALPGNYHQEIRELQARIAAENAKAADEVFGHFDCSGSNIAFDDVAGRLKGVFDFADATIGDVHKEFQRVIEISYDCALRVVDHYRRLTGRPIDMDRVMLFGVECQFSALLFYLGRGEKNAPERFLAWYEKLKNDYAVTHSRPLLNRG